MSIYLEFHRKLGDNLEPQTKISHATPTVMKRLATLQFLVSGSFLLLLLWQDFHIAEESRERSDDSINFGPFSEHNEHLDGSLAWKVLTVVHFHFDVSNWFDCFSVYLCRYASILS